MNNRQIIRTALLAGPLVALGLAASTASARDQVDASNVEIALAIVVVGAALVDRWAGLATAAVAALSFNFFHTEPYHSLRIHAPRDVVIVALLAGLGVVVSDIGAWRRRREVVAVRHGEATAAPQRLAALLHEQQPVRDVWPTLAGSIMDQLALADCRFDPSSTTTLPTISRTDGRHADGDDGFVLPSTGAALAVVSDGTTLGLLILAPAHGVPSLWIERRVAIALADHLAIALTYTGHDRSSSPSSSSSSSSGADDYVTKPFGMAELVARIRAVLRRNPEASVDQPEVETPAFRLDLAAHRAFVGDERHEVRLTPIEWSIVGHLVRNPHRLVTYRQLVSAVWGPNDDPDQNLLRVHMGHIRRKLELDSGRPSYFVTDSGVGYRFQPDG